MRIEMDLRNVPLNRLQEYLVEAGGTLDGERAAHGENWHAVLEELEPVRLGVMNIRRDLLVIEGDDEAVEAVHNLMRFRTMRGGG